MSDISRRTLLKRLVLTVVIGVLPASVRRAPRVHSDILTARLLACLSHRRSAQLLGARYLAQVPQQPDTVTMAERIAGGARRVRALAAMDEPSLRRRLADQRRRDFATGRTVDVNGWILSRTEAQLCALAALEHTIG